MKVSALYTYPIKSLRPSQLQEAELTRHGFRYDRRFMLLKVEQTDGRTTYKNMQVTTYNEMVLFQTSLQTPLRPDGKDGLIKICFKAEDRPEERIEIPLVPDIKGLSTTEVDMYTSTSTAYIMPAQYNDWFSKCFGFDAVLVYLGPGLRPVKMSTQSSTLSASGILGSLAVWTGLTQHPAEHVTFADCAAYLVVSEKSMDDVHPRLPAGERMDITKFRPNIIVSGADEAWEEDYWAELTFNKDTKMACVHNCGRCRSINIDFVTGKQSTAEAGQILARLQKDRRVDPGMKYSPIFGRYAFIPASSDGHVIRLGDEVSATRLNSERTVFDWIGLSTLPKK